MSRVAAHLSLISLMVMVLAFLHRNDFPADMAVAPTLEQEPQQRRVLLQPFTTEVNGEQYAVIQKFEYELNGLVVSYRHHDAKTGTMLHALAKDHFNVADLCVVWGESTNPDLLCEFEFSNGQFACNYGTNSQMV